MTPPRLGGELLQPGGVTVRKKLVLLGSLYLAQGLPYGFFTQALPVLLRESGMSLPLIGLAQPPDAAVGAQVRVGAARRSRCARRGSAAAAR